MAALHFQGLKGPNHSRLVGDNAWIVKFSFSVLLIGDHIDHFSATTLYSKTDEGAFGENVGHDMRFK